MKLYIDDLAFRVNVEDFSIANDIVSWLTTVRCLNVHGGFEGKRNELTWALMGNAVQRLPELEHLCISREGWGLYLGPILEHLDIPSLRALSVSGISETPNGAMVLEPKVGSLLQLSSSHE
jgi:hypothetical protein